MQFHRQGGNLVQKSATTNKKIWSIVTDCFRLHKMPVQKSLEAGACLSEEILLFG